MRNIISISRRTDIPAFYADWFLERLRQGYVSVRNPYGGKVSRVSLRPDSVAGFVFWSKNFGPLIPHLDEIEKTTKNLSFHFTITGIPKNIEQHTPPVEEAIGDYRRLADRYSPERIVWRFDPLVITDRLPFEHYEEAFSRLAEKLRGRCFRCIISFVERYKKVLANVARYSDHRLPDVPEDARRAYARRLADIGGRYGISLFACCNDYLLSDRVGKARCINGVELARMHSDPGITASPAPTRKECACTKSIDIGAYDTCAHGCLYCYANADKEKARATHRRQELWWNALGEHVAEKNAE